jgi:hypothetical protein
LVNLVILLTAAADTTLERMERSGWDELKLAAVPPCDCTVVEIEQSSRAKIIALANPAMP